MDDIQFEQLKKDLDQAYEDEKNSEIAFKEKVVNHNAINLPEGFELNIELENRVRRNETQKTGISFTVSDGNKKAGEAYPKFFWTMDGRTRLMFENDELIDYDSRSLSGGLNETEYNRRENPKNDYIGLHEKTLEINQSYVNILKIAKADLQFFLTPLNEYREANKKLNDLSDEYDKEVASRKASQKIKDLEVIKEGFQTLGPKTINKLLNKFKHTDESEISLSVVAVDESSRNNENMHVRELTITCKKGARTSYSLQEGNFVGSTIKAADVASHLARGVVLDGKRAESVKEFAEMYSVDSQIQKYSREFEVTTGDLAKVVPTLKTDLKTDIKSKNINKLR